MILFSIEYIIRLCTAKIIYPDLSPVKARLTYDGTPMAIIDLLSIIPFYLSLIKLVGFLRVFKINRYTSSLSLIGQVLKARSSQLLSSITIILVLIFIDAMLMYDIEHLAQPEVFDNALSAMWWAMATITTVGYGDI